VAAELIRGARYRVLEAESAKAAMAVAGRGEISSTRRPLKSFMSRDIRRVRGWSGTTANAAFLQKPFIAPAHRLLTRTAQPDQSSIAV